MKGYVIRLVEKVGGTFGGSDAARPGDYLMDWDLEFFDGRGAAWWTADVDKAHVFPSSLAAMLAYRSQPKAKPLRDDGRPNCPLTAYTVEVIRLRT